MQIKGKLGSVNLASEGLCSLVVISDKPPRGIVVSVPTELAMQAVALHGKRVVLTLEPDPEPEPANPVPAEG